MAQAPQRPVHPAPQAPPRPNAPPPTPQNPPQPPGQTPGGPSHPHDPTAEPKNDDERKALETAFNPPDFKLAKPGSRDYVAGQPVDEKELEETMAEAKKRMEVEKDPKTRGGTAHEKFVNQYGDKA